MKPLVVVIPHRREVALLKQAVFGLRAVARGGRR
jgi:hypothetical protein